MNVTIMLETANAMYVIKFVELLCSRSFSFVQVANQKFRAVDVTNEDTNVHFRNLLIKQLHPWQHRVTLTLKLAGREGGVVESPSARIFCIF